VVRIDRGEVIGVVRRYLQCSDGTDVDLISEDIVDVVLAELKRQRGSMIAAGLADARLRGGGRPGRAPLSAERRSALLDDYADGFSYREIGERHPWADGRPMSVTAVGRYVRGEV
jgi:hypothetical protein